MTDEFARPEGARTEEVRRLSEEANRQGSCLFCKLPEQNVLHFETDHWKVFDNLSPFEGTDHHIMMASQRHIVDLEGLDPEAWLDLFACLLRIQGLFGLTSYSILSRLGRPGYTATTIYHLHVHAVSSDRLPATLDMLPLGHEHLIKDILKRLPPHPDGALEALDELMRSIDIYRASMQGKAFPIRAKLSNKVDPDRVP